MSTTTGTYAYPISSGVLGTAIVVSTDQAYAIQIDATSSWLVEAIPGTGGVQISAISINSTTGAFNTGSAVQTASFAVANAAVQQNKMAISQDNNYVFVALGAGGTIVVPFNSSAPFPSGITAYTIPVANASGSALSVAVDPSSTPRLFYIGETLATPAPPAGCAPSTTAPWAALPSPRPPALPSPAADWRPILSCPSPPLILSM